MTPQELFDTALLGVIAQDACSYNTEGGEVQCLYRDGKGNKCAAGQLIPDDQYKPDMEGQPASIIDFSFGSTPEHGRAIDFAQDIHDSAAQSVADDLTLQSALARALATHEAAWRRGKGVPVSTAAIRAAIEAMP